MRRVTALKDLKAKRGWPYSESQTWRLIRAGVLPKPFKLPGCNLVLFDDDELDACFEAAMAARDVAEDEAA